MAVKITRSGTGLADLAKGLERAQSLAGNHSAICPRCGSTKMRFDPDAGDEAPIHCECGHFMGSKSEVAEGIKERVLGEIKKALKTS